MDPKSYLSALSPRWASRNPTPAVSDSEHEGPPPDSPKTAAPQRAPQDHFHTHKHRLSLRKYPRDCPPLKVRWFHAVDVPKYKPLPSGKPRPKDEKPAPAPKKFLPFSERDSTSIETAYQYLIEEEEGAQRRGLAHTRNTSGGDLGEQPENLSLEGEDGERKKGVTVPCQEDYLFDVHIEQRELAPAYWLGPVYEARRGTWFYQDSSALRPCDENLATQLEEGYLKVKPWTYGDGSKPQRSTSQSRSRPTSLRGDGTATKTGDSPVADKSHPPEVGRKVAAALSLEKSGISAEEAAIQAIQKTHRLFGSHMNSLVTYQDTTVAWMLTDDFLSRMSGAMYERFAGGGHFAGVKLVRGYSDLAKKVDDKNAPAKLDEKIPIRPGKNRPRALSDPIAESPTEVKKDPLAAQVENRRQTLERQLSSLISPGEEDEEAVRKREEEEMEHDYNDEEGAEQGRPIEHLLLVTHGIGQRLGLRLDSVNFVSDVNTLRKTLKAVYGQAPDLQALNAELDDGPRNSRVQVLPISWRHKLDFPKQSLRHNRREMDLSDAAMPEDDQYPTLDDITVDGVPAVRNLITDLALDVLLFQSSYRDHIARIVTSECNRIYRLFCERNPNFRGKVSLVGHSLGSAVMFDMLCEQKEKNAKQGRHGHHSHNRRSKDESLQLDFDVEDFYALGSPIALFQMLRGRTVSARESRRLKALGIDEELSEDILHDNSPFGIPETHYGAPVSAPKCAQLYNVFHPADPISYRLEPLISPSMASLKPQPLPYTKRGIFGTNMAQGITGIGSKVGEMWSNFSTGIASSLLNRSLGLSNADASRLGDTKSSGALITDGNRAPGSVPLVKSTPSMGAGTNIIPRVVPTIPVQRAQGIKVVPTTSVDASEDAVEDSTEAERPMTLLDAEVETLYANFEKRRRQSDVDTRDLGEHPEAERLEERGRKLKREEAKVRALNSNGRVDYSLQEGAFDITLIASIASHLTYWSDEDVSHFMISQLLSRQRRVKHVRKG